MNQKEKDIQYVSDALIRWRYEPTKELIEKMINMMSYDGNWDINDYKKYLEDK